MQIISIFPLWTFYLYVSTFQQYLHMKYTYQLIRYVRACFTCANALDRGLLVTIKWMKKWFLVAMLRSTFSKVYGCDHGLVNPYRMCVSHILAWICSGCRGYSRILFFLFHDLLLNMTWHQIFTISGEGDGCPSVEPELTPVCKQGWHCPIIIFLCSIL